jgi:hypothetical protein
LSNGRLWRLVHKDSSYKLEADLRDNAYKALEHLIQGFIEPSANGLTVEDLPAIYSNSLYLLF